MLQHGDKIRTRARRIPLAWHYGIWDAVRRVVIHNTLPGGVQTTTLESFRNGETYIEWRAAEGYGDVVVARAYELLGKNYDLVRFNCEHFVNVATTGDKKSRQLRNAVGIGLLLAAVFSPSEATYDASVERYRDSRGRFTR